MESKVHCQWGHRSVIGFLWLSVVIIISERRRCMGFSILFNSDAGIGGGGSWVSPFLVWFWLYWRLMGFSIFVLLLWDRGGGSWVSLFLNNWSWRLMGFSSQCRRRRLLGFSIPHKQWWSRRHMGLSQHVFGWVKGPQDDQWPADRQGKRYCPWHWWREGWSFLGKCLLVLVHRHRMWLTIQS